MRKMGECLCITLKFTRPERTVNALKNTIILDVGFNINVFYNKRCLRLFKRILYGEYIFINNGKAFIFGYGAIIIIFIKLMLNNLLGNTLFILNIVFYFNFPCNIISF